jgi:SSS family transporter
MQFLTAHFGRLLALALLIQFSVGERRVLARETEARVAAPYSSEPAVRQDAVGPHPATEKMLIQPWKIPTLPASTAAGFLFRLNDCFAAGAAATAETPRALTVWTLPADARSGAAAQWRDSGVVVASDCAAAQWGDAIICAGGLSDGNPSSRVTVVRVAAGRVSASALPALPKALAGAGAAVLGDTLYVFGGVSSLAPAKLESALMTLDLGKAGASWKIGPPLPDAGRAYFAVTGQYGMLCVFGGTVSRADGSFEASQQSWAYRPEPLEGTSESGWQRWADLPQPLTHALAVPLGQAHVMVLGGGDRLGDNAIPGTYDPPVQPHTPLLFHTLTDAWCGFDQPFGLTDPLAVKNGPDVLVLGGETAGGKSITVSREIDIPHSVRQLAWIDYALILAYFGLLAGIGVWFSRKQESSAEFSLGNRKVKWWAAGISMFATAASAITFMAVPALAFATNLVWTLPLIVMVPAYYVTGYLIYPLLRRMEITSTYEYLERRFNRPLRLIASGQCILFQAVGRASFVLVLPALAISTVTGISVWTSVWVMGILTTIYTSLGGFEAVIWTEVFQGLLKFLAPLLMIIFCLKNLPHGAHDFAVIGSKYHKFDVALLTWDYTIPALWILLTFTFLQNTVNQAGDQPVIQRVFSTPLPQVRRVAATSTVCGIVIGGIANLLGLSIFTYFHTHPEKFDPGAQNDQIVPLFVAQAMPAGAAGIVIAAIFASAMATVASSMNSVATVFTEDFYLRARPMASDRERLRVLKTCSYAAGAVGTGFALLLASLNLKSMMAAWSEIGALLGGGIVGVYTLGMFTRRANGFGAVCGAIVSIIMTLAVKLYTSIHWQAYTPIAILSCMIFGYAFSLLAPQSKNLEGLTVFTPKFLPP